MVEGKKDLPRHLSKTSAENSPVLSRSCVHPSRSQGKSGSVAVAGLQSASASANLTVNIGKVIEKLAASVEFQEDLRIWTFLLIAGSHLATGHRSTLVFFH